MKRSNPSKKIFRLLLVGATCLVFIQGSAVAQTESASLEKRTRLAPEDLYKQTVLGTVWIVGPKGEGSGWILDKKRGYIVTNYHCVDDTEDVNVFFPKFEEGQLVTDVESYRRYTKPINAHVVDCDREKDLAILKVAQVPNRCRQLPLAAKSATPAQRVHAIGGHPKGSQSVFIYCSGNVRQVSNGTTAIGGKARILSMTTAINPGNSGGPVVDDFGCVVGVVEGEVYIARDVTWAIDVEDLRNYVKTVESIYPPQTTDQNVKALMRHYTSRHLNNAIQYGNNAVRLDPQNAKAFEFRGWSFYLKRDYDSALVDFNTSIELNPGSDEAYRGRGSCYLQSRDYQQALKDFSKSLSINPKNRWAHLERARVFKLQRKYDLALKAYSNAVKNNPTSDLPYRERGNLYLALNQVENAKRDLTQVTKIAPYFWGNFNDLGVCYKRQGEYDLAKQYFQRAAEMNPNSYLPYFNLAQCLFATKQFDMAIEFASESIVRQPNNSDLFALRAEIHAVRKDFAEAQRDISNAIALNNSIASYYYQRHDYLRALGYSNAAEKDLVVARRLDGTRHTVAKPATGSKSKNGQLSGLWVYEGKFKGKDYVCAVEFIEDTFAYRVTFKDSSGVPVEFGDTGTFRIYNSTTLKLNNTSHKFELKNGYLYMTFPQIKIKFPMKQIRR